MDTKEIINAYNKGHNIVIMPTKTHAPTGIQWSRWCDERQTPQELVGMMVKHPNYSNVGVICGYNNHIVLDFDSFEEYARYISAGYPIDTYAIRTGRGVHLHFRVRKLDKTIQYTHPSGCEVWVNSKFALIPPSIHKSGKPYTVHNDKPIMAIDCITSLGAARQAAERRNSGFAGVEQPENNQNNFSLSGACERSSLDALKLNTPISTILGDCSFTRSGQHHKLGFCPLHDDNHKSLSLHINTNKVRCKSQGCVLSNKWHSVIDLWMLVNGGTVGDAIKALQPEPTIDDLLGMVLQ